MGNLINSLLEPILYGLGFILCNLVSTQTNPDSTDSSQHLKISVMIVLISKIVFKTFAVSRHNPKSQKPKAKQSLLTHACT